MENTQDDNNVVSWTQTIKERVDIVGYIQRFETLKEIGNGEWQGSHSTSHESRGGKCLNISREKQIGHCYGCDYKGNVIDWEMHRSGASYTQACIAIAQASGIKLPPAAKIPPEEQAKHDQAYKEQKEVTELLNRAARFFHNQLDNNSRQYYRDRGITDETIDLLLLGYAPEQKFTLYKHMQTFTRDKEVLLKTGLFTEQGENLYPVFRKRYVIPYFANNIDICYFIARDATGGKSYIDSRTGKEKTPPKYKKLINTGNPAVQHILYNSHQIGKEKPILITEGIIDAILAHQELPEYDVISPTTVRINNSDLRRIIDLLLLIGIDRTIIFCNDNESSRSGSKGALDTAIKLQEGIEKTLQKAKDAKQKINDKDPAKMGQPNIRITTLRKPPERDKIDVADYVQAGKISELRHWIKASRTIERYQHYIEGNSQRFFDGKSFVVKELTDELESDGRYYCADKDNLYRYNQGVYREATKPTLKIAANKLDRKQNPRYINDAVDMLKINRYIDNKDYNPHQYLNCQNGIVDLDSPNLQLIPHTPDIPFTTQIPVDFNKKANCPKFDKFLHEIVPKDTVILVYEMIGYCLVYTNQMHKAFLLDGEGANGKSTLIMAIEKLLGSDNYCNFSWQSLESPQTYATAMLDGKLANLYADIPKTPIKKCDVFNSITGGDTIEARHIYGKPFNFKPITTLIFSCNQVPTSYTQTQGFYRRWIIIKFPNTFDGKRKQEDILSEITTPEEMSGILGTSLACVKNVLAPGGSFSVPETSKEALEEYKQQNEPALRFLSENTLAAPNHVIVRSALYNAYKDWIEKSEPNRKPQSDKKFYQCVRNMYPKIIDDPNPRRINGKRQRCFDGIKLEQTGEENSQS